MFYDYEPCRRDAAKSEERQYQDFVHMVKNSFDEAKELFLNKNKEFDYDEVIEQINADIAEMRLCGLTDPEGEAIASKVCAINVDIDEGAFRMSGDAGRESVPNGRDVFYFRYFNSDYHFRISENCFKMDDPEDKYFIEITHFNKDTGEYDPHFYMGLSPAL